MSHSLQPVAELATTDDLDGLINVYFDAFCSDDFNRIFPPDGAGREYQTRAWKSFLQRNVSPTQECRIFVIRDDDGKSSTSALVVPFCCCIHSGYL